MDYPNYTTEHQKGKHLTYDNRMMIQIRLKDGWTPYRMAKDIGCACNTVRNEIKRGQVTLYRGKVIRYKASEGQAAYEKHRLNSRNCYSRLAKEDFIDYVVERFQKDGWSLDACHGRAVLSGQFTAEQTVSTKTLYNYVDLGLIAVKNIDLPLKLRLNPKTKHTHENKRKLGRSIEERPQDVESREEFGHWEADLVIGQKSGEDKALLTLAERKSRNFFIIPIADKTAQAVMDGFMRMRGEYVDKFDKVFKTLTTDNGSEFARLQELEAISKTLVYYAHPFSSWEKGTNERHNGLIRRFIPKGKRIDQYSLDDIVAVEMWCNQLPRKILGYNTPEEIFEAELDKIYAA
jgi:IS30 family transposase